MIIEIDVASLLLMLIAIIIAFLLGRGWSDEAEEKHATHGKSAATAEDDEYRNV